MIGIIIQYNQWDDAIMMNHKLIILNYVAHKIPQVACVCVCFHACVSVCV
uniref:Uncharacterized protein n=1 Tax=Anguilla anguilla TaxID=7936 RepID=A0A0E9TGL7_ANGAN